jgi:uncharacterized protein (TIGR02246 family)
MFKGAQRLYVKWMIGVLSGVILIWAGQYLYAQGEGKELKSSEQNPRFPPDRAIRFSVREFTEAFNRGDAKAIGALLTDDCDYGDGVGNIYHGRDEIEKEYADFFAANPGAKIKIDISSIRLPGPGTAIEDGTSTVTLANGPASEVQYRVLHVRQNGQWLMTSIRESVDETPSHYANLRDLEWLIGNWVARGSDRQVYTSFQWMDNKNFLQRTYTVKMKEGVVLSGLQIIGWDPAARCVMSWTFDSTGGYGHGVWRPVEKGWSITSTGIMADGTAVSSTENTTKIDDDHFTWQSVNRTAQGTSLPDTEEIVVERVKGK